MKRDWPALAERLERGMPTARVRLNEPIGAMTTYRVGGRARLFVEANSRADLNALAAVKSTEPSLECLILGRGSNLLVGDEGFDGLAIHLGRPFSYCRILGNSVVAGAAMALPAVARRCAAIGIGGFSWAVGVPGSIGGAIRMNAGCHGSDISQVISSASGVDLSNASEFTLTTEQLLLGYRTSSLQAHQLVYEALFKLCLSDSDTEREALKEVVHWRRLNQPGGSNAGSVFVNPEGDSAGRLIEASGCKGMRVGSAVISRKHANFIITDEGGSAADVFLLMKKVAAIVLREMSVELLPETRLIGFEQFQHDFGEQ